MTDTPKIETLEQLIEWAVREFRFDYKWKPSVSTDWDSETRRYLVRQDNYKWDSTRVELSEQLFAPIENAWKRSEARYSNKFVGQRSPVSIITLVDKTAGAIAARRIEEAKHTEELNSENNHRRYIRREAQKLIEQTAKFLADHNKYGDTLEALTQIPDKESE